MPEFVKPAAVPVRAIVREIDESFSDDKKGEKEFQASLIEVQGRVRGSRGYGYLNYISLGGNSPGQARNDARIQARANTPVLIGYEDDVPVIKRLDYSRMDPQGAQGYRSPLFDHHALDHKYGSGDTAWIDTRQIESLMVIPAGLFKVNITPGRYGNGLDYAYFAGRQNYDLAAYQPAVAGTKRKVGLYLDSAGALQVVSGGLVARTAVIPPLPWPAGIFRLASVILFEDKDFIDWEYIKQEKALYANPVTKATGLYTPAGVLAWEVEADGDLSNPGGGYLDAGAVSGLYACDGRLTLTSGTAVTTSDVTAATTLYFTPHNGNRLALYDGSRWVMRTFSELSLSLSGLAANTNYDVFGYIDGVDEEIEHLAWSSATARATALALQDGVLVKSGDAPRRYIGTFRTTGTTGQCEDSETRRFCWNYYNRALRRMNLVNGSSHTYGPTTTVRAFNNGGSGVSSVLFVLGVLDQDINTFLVGTGTFVSGDSQIRYGVGVNTNTAHSVQNNWSSIAIALSVPIARPTKPQLGLNEYWMTESTSAAGTAPTFGSAALSPVVWG